MGFLYPIGFLAFLSLGAIIIMYMLKQKQTVEPFSTNMFWEKAVLRTMANKPWQKLRKSLLLFLQLLLAALITLALVNPYIKGGASYSHYVVVIDCSYSMQAVDVKPTRFDAALKQAEEFIESCPQGSFFSVIAAKDYPFAAVNSTDNKSQAISGLKGLKPTNVEVDETALFSMLTSFNQEEGVQFVSFSDKGFGFTGLNIAHKPIGEKGENIALTALSHSVDSDRIIAMVKVKNFGSEMAENKISLYADGLLFDMKAFSLEAGAETDVFFTNVPVDTVRLSAELTDEDILPADNFVYDVVKGERVENVVLFTEGNVFLENALRLIPSINLYVGDVKDIESAEGYYLYIYDGVTPETFPENGHVIMFNPISGSELFSIRENKFYPEEIIVNDRSFLNNIDSFDFSIASSSSFSLNSGASALLSSAGEVIAYSEEINGAKKAVFGFDLHETNLPLKKEFPIFVYNLIGWFVPENIFGESKVFAGDIINVNVYPDAQKVTVTTPEGNARTILPPNPAESFDDTGATGFYTVEQQRSSGVAFDEFPVNIKIGESSDLSKGYNYSQSEEGAPAESTGKLNLSNIIIIICIILILVEWYVLSRGVVKLPDWVRITLIAILIFALFDFNINKETKKTAVVFAVDTSDSVADKKGDIQAAINGGLINMGKNDIAGLTTFSKDASVKTMPSGDVNNFQINGDTKGEYTNISKGLMASMGILPDDYNKKIVLVTDGNENLGDAYLSAKQLHSQGIVVDVLPVDSVKYKDAQITRINVPERIGKDMGYNIEVVTYALGENTAKLNLYKNNTMVLSDEIEMKNGENRYVFSDIADVGGNIVYKAEIIPNEDYSYKNNKAYAYSYVDHVPRILIVDDMASAAEIEKIIDNTSIEYETLPPMFLPTDLESLNMYDGVILANINYDDLPQDFSEVLESYVKNGGGLLATAGDNSYAIGSYYKTKLEDILPVNMELKSKEELPDQAMVIVLDRSGSMSSGRYGVSKLAMAKEAVIRSIDALNENDYYGVLTFDTVNQWVVEPNMVGDNKAGIIDKVASINEGGGTSIKPAVTEAFNKLKGMDTKLKHIILLTDGQDGDRNYTELINQLKAEGITLSTVAVGGDSDITLLESMAEDAGGRYYFTDEFSDLPKIFTKEAFLSGKKYLNNEMFMATAGSYSPIMENIDGLPPFYGYVSSTAKPRADVVLYAQNEEPLLAAWQYGIGRSVAFLTDMEGNWSRDMLLTDEGVRLFTNMVSWIIRDNVGMEIYAQAERVSGGAEITMNLPYSAGVRSLSAVITTPELEEIQVDFTQVSPGEYKGSIPNDTEGTYIATVALTKDSGIEYTNCGINLAYSREYDLRQAEFGRSLLERIALAGGGQVLTAENNFFEYSGGENSIKVRIKPFVILLALLFLLFDIAYHRFPAIKSALKLSKYRTKLKKNNKNVELNLDKELTVKIESNKNDDDSDASGPNNNENHGSKSVSTSAKLASVKKKRSGR
ncbi:VWA domain-containing protein [Tyzzerella sp. OttesenSCG-928-J15]|nr:VWA domain-containing protein [Tyzzerella sp. OttesenSCG-928-J15]